MLLKTKFKLNILGLTALATSVLGAQPLPDSCKLNIGTNLGGLADYGTEIPFKDLMKTCRKWYSKDVNNPNPPFNSNAAASMTYRPDGYPSHIPQTVAGQNFKQKVATIWAITSGWQAGEYVVLFDGVGSLGFWGGLSGLTQTGPNRYTFNFLNPMDNAIEMTIDSSLASDPVRNIRVVLKEFETNYLTEPFNPVWINKLKIFKSVRFMDWGQTNNWGQPNSWTWQDSSKQTWANRAKLDHYTWATAKGVPYEMMVKLMNDYDLDGWVCVPHNASNSYIDSMAMLFHTGLQPQRELTVEYSNEIWNWMFGQAQWCNTYGCVNKGISWPEGIVPYIQNCMDRWTAVYGADIARIKRAVGVQTGWTDVAQRTVFNMRPNSFDAISPTYYFGLGTQADSVLDDLGASATVADVAYWTRYTRDREGKSSINAIKTTIADSLKLPLYFYEGGQHITPHPFGTEPSYANALLAIQRDTAMFNLYNEWYAYLRTLQSGDEPLKLMNFSFISNRSARYGSWGILETMNQDTSQIYAPKYSSTLLNMAKGDCFSTASYKRPAKAAVFAVYPNPAHTFLFIESKQEPVFTAQVYETSGRLLQTLHSQTAKLEIDIASWPAGLYYVTISGKHGIASHRVIKD